MLYPVFIPLLLLFVPWLVVRFVFSTPKTRRMSYGKSVGYLVLAAGLWALAMRVPNIPISPETDTFSMHMIGGIVATVLFLYVKRAYGWRFDVWWHEWVGLFFFVSTLGVLNELFELFLNKVAYPGMILGDERWDLLANTVGAFISFGVYLIGARLIKRYNAKRTHS